MFVVVLIVCFLSSNICFSASHDVPWDLIKQYLPENPVVIEAGAQFGEDTKIMADMWPSGKLYAFEPMPENYKKLEELAAERDNVFASTYALTNEKKSASFWVCGGASSLLRPTDGVNSDYFHADLDHPIRVNCITLDEWCRDQGITQADFFWFDMEGNELNALQGAQEILKTVKAIFIEVNLRTFWHGNVLYKDLKNWLTQRGFKEAWSHLVPHWNGNVLFVRDN